MQGEYRGDFTRDTFDKTKHFLRVLQQQGRVWLDADFNEQTAILLHYLQSLAMDLVGPHGGPGDGFVISQLTDPNGALIPLNFKISSGHYYVDGILCENDDSSAWDAQAGFPFLDAATLEKTKSYLVYLDVWERHISYIEDEDKDRNNPSIREVALGGPDTAARAKIVWQVKVTNKLQNGQSIPSSLPSGAGNWRSWVEKYWLDQWQRIPLGQLEARAKKNSDEAADPCITSPDSKYRGAENQLYRVEVHKPGTAKDGATFKWSRENGSVVIPIRKLASADGSTAVTLENLGRDSRIGLTEGDWLEIVDDDYILQNRAGNLLQVQAINRDEMTVTLKGLPDPDVGRSQVKHPLLRRWDQHNSDKSQPTKDGVVIAEGDKEQNWIELEDGIQIQFQPSATQQAHQYRTGDYWLIPARTATGDVEWPGPGNAPKALEPHGVEHHYAPLAIITVDPTGKVTPTDVRRKFTALGQ